MINVNYKLGDFLEKLANNCPDVKVITLFYQDKKLWSLPIEKAKMARGTRGIKTYETKLFPDGEMYIIHGYNFEIEE